MSDNSQKNSKGKLASMTGPPKKKTKPNPFNEECVIVDSPESRVSSIFSPNGNAVSAAELGMTEQEYQQALTNQHAMDQMKVISTSKITRPLRKSTTGAMVTNQTPALQGFGVGRKNVLTTTSIKTGSVVASNKKKPSLTALEMASRILTENGREPKIPGFTRSTKGKEFLGMLTEMGYIVGAFQINPPQAGSLPAYKSDSIFLGIVPSISTKTEKRVGPNNQVMDEQACYSKQLDYYQELDLLHFVFNCFLSEGEPKLLPYMSHHQVFEKAKKELEDKKAEQACLVSGQPQRIRGGSGHGMAFAPGSGAGGPNDFTFDDWLRDLSYHISPVWQHHFLFDIDYNQEQYELLAALLHHWYDSHSLEAPNTENGVTTNIVSNLNQTYQTIKVLGLVVKVAYGTRQAQVPKHSVQNWDRTGRPKLLAEHLIAYLVELHSGWKPQTLLKMSESNLKETNLHSSWETLKKRCKKVVDKTALTKAQGSSSTHYLHYRAANFMFDLNTQVKRKSVIFSKKLPEHVMHSFQINTDRIYATHSEVQDEESKLPEVAL
jgi:hypothetical protein